LIIAVYHMLVCLLVAQYW